MGIVHMGIPKETVEFLKEKLSLTTFIEGGTYKGKTASYASNLFDKVYTIEMSNFLYEEARENLSPLNNVTVLKGDTREYLNDLTSKNNNLLFWLDSHWSGGETYGETDECPLLEELRLIFKYKKNMAVLVDDARLFLSPPPEPHKLENWPQISQIVNLIPKDYEILVYEDVIYIMDSSKAIPFKKFVQKKKTMAEKRKILNSAPIRKVANLVKFIKNSF